MKLTRTFIALGLLTVAATTEAQRKPPATRLTPLDAYVAGVMKDWKVPGIAIAIVKDDSVVFSKGYGVRTVGSTDAVDPTTLFAIGSSSKAFTSALVAMAVDEGKMRWDEKVTHYLPSLQLNDLYASRDLTIRDALSHRSGLARGDLMWYVAGFSREEILRRVRYLEPSWGFRALFGYQNIMYLAAGEAVAKAQGASWDDLIARRIFQPLGMGASSTSITALAGKPNVATPHAEQDSAVIAIPWKNIDNIAPAGSINSNVLDMTRWLRLQLGKGKFGGKTIISSGNHADMWQANTHIRLEGPTAAYLAPGANLSSYGMGWFLQDFDGRLAVHHGGNIDGFSAMVAMLPAEQLGVVILTNKDGSPAPNALFPYIFDLYTRATPRDWSGEYRKMLGGLTGAVAQAESALVKGRAMGTRPSLALDGYVGTYSDSMYGDVQVSKQGDKLAVKFGILNGTLEHWHYDTFRATMTPARLGKMMVSFTLDPAGKPAELKLETTPEATYRYAPPAADTRASVTLSAEQLRSLTGTFVAEMAPLELQVEIVGDALKLTVPGQPAYTLVALSPTRFRLTGPTGMPDGFYFQYEMSGSSVVGATLEQPAPRPPLKVKKKQ